LDLIFFLEKEGEGFAENLEGFNTAYFAQGKLMNLGYGFACLHCMAMFIVCTT